MKKRGELTMEEKKKIEERVKKIHFEFKSILKDDNFDIVKFARQLGFVIGNARLDEDEDGFIAINPKGTLGNLFVNKVIAVNFNRTFEKKRFIIAHELGHYFLNAKEGAMMYAQRERHNTIDSEEENIDYFAACLLMPEEKFKMRYNELEKEVNNGSIDKESIVRKMSNIFGVDEGAIVKRFGEVNIKYE